ncbi:hypothetical protein F5883DRAFT_620866 [Diaporthe sp. PMI_573]|nr:hypothetical protein F5883DRAFT_620866 [Diaporthaceae sp. PMI_573]
MPHEGVDHPPAGANNAHSQGRQRQGHDVNHSQGDQSAPSLAQARQSGGGRPPQGGHTAPSSGRSLFVHCSQPVGNPQSAIPRTRSIKLPAVNKFLTFPECGHVITGDLLRDFFTTDLPTCPVCEVRTMGLSPCGHMISGDGLRELLSSGSNQCLICTSSGRKASEATETRDDGEASAASNNSETTAHNERNRVTLLRYNDPTKLSGVTSEVYTNKDGRPRFRVDPDVWRSMTRQERKQFLWGSNVKFSLPPGESAQEPANPGNPRHPEYRPTSIESQIRGSFKGRPNPDAMCAAVKGLVDGMKNDQARRNAQARGQPTVVGTQAVFTPNQGNEATQSRLSGSAQGNELISLDDSAPADASSDVQPRPDLSKEVRDQLSQIDW